MLLYPAGIALLRGTHDDKFFAADDASGLITEQLGVVRTAVGESLEQ